jgi:hypothetical protein
VINPSWQLVEEALQLSEVGSIKGRGVLCAKLARCALKGLRIAGGEDELRAPITGQSSGFEADAGATADHNDGLAEKLRFALQERGPGGSAHNSSDRLSKASACPTLDSAGIDSTTRLPKRSFEVATLAA